MKTCFRTQNILRLVALLLALAISSSGQQVVLPGKANSVRFAVIGDSGTGEKAAYEIAHQVASFHAKFPFEFALLLGDNIYGRETSADYVRKFERPYKPLLDAGVKFYAALGNHDDAGQRSYKYFNMNSERFYSFKKNNVRFFALDSNYMDKEQLEWLEKELANSGSEWKIAYFHHPLYSSGKRHGPDDALRTVLEPLFLKYGVSVVLTGHEHFYERLKPQKGIYYFIAGASSKLRRSNIARTGLTEKGFDQDNSFMLVEIVNDKLYFQTITRKGVTIDSAVLPKSRAKPSAVSARRP